ncbi:exonuclease subunit SbcD [Ferrimonas senticii]|uniref:exonuclease subunit SbcD n=1 Tax=Ferrimonas senticii TaxID=394566 RepID=UPI000420CB75|nr:exonuclease subunit SbcD [Ferrimonas senticii]
MRILHTSDWHLGQSFFGKSRANEHNAFIDWLLDYIEQQQIDALIVAGDLFDTATPPSYARAIYARLISALSQQHCQLLLLGGNHDSVAMLSESQPLLAALNTHLLSHANDDYDNQLVILKNAQQQEAAIVCMVPYLRPRDLQRSSAGQDGNEKRLQLQQSIAAHYHNLYQAACQLRGERALPIIATGHLTTVGARSSDSERELYIGTLDAFPASAFPPVDYLALGHIHRSQMVAGLPHLRYSGSPIPLSFDELGRDKVLLQIEFCGTTPSISEVPIPRFQALAQLRGNLNEIERQLAQFAENPQNTWLDIEVAEDDYLSDLHQRIAALCQDLPVEVLKVRRARRGSCASDSSQPQPQDLTELSIDEVFEQRLAQEIFSDEAALARRQRLQQLFAETHQQLNDKPAEAN